MGNPILVKKKTFGPPLKDGKEGKYYKNEKTGKTYQFVCKDNICEYKEVGSEEKDDRPKVEIKLEE